MSRSRLPIGFKPKTFGNEPWFFHHFDKIFTGIVITIIGVTLLQVAAILWIGKSASDYCGDHSGAYCLGKIVNEFSNGVQGK